jgi:TatD DNase family protein
VFDSHCHLTDGRFDEDRAVVVARAREAGVLRIVTVASDLADARAAKEFAESYDGVWHTVGIHPHEAGATVAGDLECIGELLADSPLAVAVGECGLDYHYDHSSREIQRRIFDRQLELAHDLELPAVIHSREAEADTIAALRNVPSGTRFVLHCFTSGRELLDVGLELDAWVSFSGIVTFRKFDAPEMVVAVPRDRLMVETDAPYLAPVPYRGKRNEPAFVPRVVETVARIRGEDPDDVARYTTTSANEFYGLDH